MKQFLQYCIRTAVLLSCLLLLGGCGGTGKQSMHTRISLADIQVLEMRTLETTFQAGIRILNPGETTLIIQGISCDLSIDGRHFASGLSGEQYEIPAYGTAIIQVPVYASTLDMITSILQRIQSSQTAESQVAPLQYELTGHLQVMQGENGTSSKLPFETSGELTFDEPQNP